MPSLSAHFTDDEIDLVLAAAKISGEKRPGTYITGAVRQRLERDGYVKGTPKADIRLIALATAEVIGEERVLAALEGAKREALAEKAAAVV
jgi:hypothetical protein